MNLKKELVDQTAHFVAAFFVLSLVAVPSVITWALAGFAIGAVREITEEGTPVTLAKVRKGTIGSWHDLVFWTLGGIAAWFAFH